MKKIIILFIFFLISVNAWTQINGGPIVQLLYSNVRGGQNDFNNKFRLGYSAGAFLRLELNDNLSLQPEALYSTKGYKYVSSTNTADSNINYKIPYIEFPVLLIYKINNNVNINFGPQIDYLVGVTGKGADGKTSVNIYNYKTTEYALSVGGAYLFSFGLKISLGFTYGLTKIYDYDTSHNLTFRLGLSYHLRHIENNRLYRTI